MDEQRLDVGASAPMGMIPLKEGEGRILSPQHPAQCTRSRERVKFISRMTDLEELLRQANAKGTDAEYHQWVKRQPSAISGVFSEYHMDTGEAFSIPCHVRRSVGAGTAYKEPFSQVPLRDIEHKMQSQLGEKACLERYLGGTWSVDEAKSWFNQKRIEYLERWIEG